MNIELKADAAAILKAMVSATGKTQEVFLSDLVNKMLKAQEKPMARTRLNAVKKTAVDMIHAGAFNNLQHFYNAAGLSNQVHTFGGINSVYHEIFYKQGLPLAEEKISDERAAAVNIPVIVPPATEKESA